MSVLKLRHHILAKSAYVAYLTVVCIAMLEVALRFWYHDPSYYWHHRYMFVSPTAFRNIDFGSWTYRPNLQIREVAVYDFPNGSMTFQPLARIEYDCRFTTNNLGFIGSHDVYPGDRVTLVLGDSFAAGQGGCPWMHLIERPAPHLMLLNAGLMGTGFGNWGRVLPYLKRHGIHIEAVVIVAISNDFKRATWHWKPEQLACIDTGVCEGSEYWHPVADNESPASLLHRARDRSASRYKEQSVYWAIKEWLKLHSYLYKSLEPFILALKGGEDNLEGHQETLSTLRKLKILDVPLKVLLVPQRDEVARQRKNADSMMAQSVLHQQGVAYTWCELSPSDYMPLDGHPSADGYRKVAECLEDLLNEVEVRPPAAFVRAADAASGGREGGIAKNSLEQVFVGTLRPPLAVGSVDGRTD